ncbi:MAG: hypothetical protein QXW39_08090 [Candidatus Bathyarchaeia archaeon]
MPLTPSGALKVFNYAVYFDGVDDYAVIPLTVYGWSGITIQEWIYPYHPKANSEWSKASMIGNFWGDEPTIFYSTDNRSDYTWLNAFFTTRKSDGKIAYYGFDVYAYRNMWVNIARRFSVADRVFIGYVNGSKTYTASIPSTEATVLEWNPATSTNPDRYKRFVLGANVDSGENMKMMQYQLLIYSRALSDSEILWNYYNACNPVRDGLVIWLEAGLPYVRDIDGDGVLEWIDLSGNGKHGKIYGAQLVQL